MLPCQKHGKLEMGSSVHCQKKKTKKVWILGPGHDTLHMFIFYFDSRLFLGGKSLDITAQTTLGYVSAKQHNYQTQQEQNPK